MWITHGDYFDGVIRFAKWLAYLGDNAYELTLRVNHYFHFVQQLWVWQELRA
jgi:UDP-2,3-diacylglucosamine pyrophosphatase LpxH